MNTGSRIPMHFAPPPHMFATNSSATAVPASLPTSRMSTRDRAQSWRGKYLRALNICPEPQDDKAVDIRQQTNSKLRTRSYHRVSDGDRNSLSKSYSSSTEKEDEERKSNSHHQASPSPSDRRIHAVPLRVPTTSSSNTPYGFVMKPGLARGRRCHTDPFLFEERVSAPIQIPTPGSVTSQLDGGHERPSHKSPMTHRLSTNTTNNTPAPLLSWEEPVAMLKAADAVARGWKMTHEDNMNMELGVQRDRGDNQLQEEDEEDHFMDDDDDDHDDIFEMDDDSSAAPSTAVAVSRRRQRTASLNIVSSGREKRVHHDMHDLSKSFVPPHQMVERDCFSIGLRDELRRRPTNHI